MKALSVLKNIVSGDFLISDTSEELLFKSNVHLFPNFCTQRKICAPPLLIPHGEVLVQLYPRAESEVHSSQKAILVPALQRCLRCHHQCALLEAERGISGIKIDDQTLIVSRDRKTERNRRVES